MTDILEIERRLSESLERIRVANASTRLRAEVAEAELEKMAQARAVLEAAKAELESDRDQLSAELAARSEPQEATEEAPGAQDVLRLTEALEAERAKNAALEEQVTMVSAQAPLDTVRMRSELEDLQSRLSDNEMALDQLRRVNVQLRQNNSALRGAFAASQPAGDLINEGLQAELEALQAVRAADRAEIDSILAALKPLIEETANA